MNRRHTHVKEPMKRTPKGMQPLPMKRTPKVKRTLQVKRTPRVKRTPQVTARSAAESSMYAAMTGWKYRWGARPS